MKLKDLLVNINYKDNDRINLLSEIDHITSDSRRVKENSIFVAIEGELGDGHDYAKSAYDKKAAYIFSQRDLGLENQIIVKNTRIAYAILCGNYNGNPGRRLKIIGITGTNGKTTVATVLKKILDNLGYKTGLLGTIENIIDKTSLPAKHTTPDPFELNVLLKKMEKAGCEYVIMETSSHGFSQHRLAGLTFEVGVFTNLTSEHLDYHKTMESYFLAKRMLFENSKLGIVTLDDIWGERLFNEFTGVIDEKTFSLKNEKADYFPVEIKKTSTSVEFSLKNQVGRYEFSMPGNYSVSNALCVIGVLEALGIKKEDIQEGLRNVASVLGRTQVLYKKDFTVIRDYAHSSDGLLNLLSTINEFKKARVLCLFGAPGRRDRGKRPDMGRVVAKYSDFFIVTSDNPREEDRKEIINEILAGVKEEVTPYEVYLDRYEGIKRILSLAKKDDIVVLAGKGHEDYQVLDYGTIAFDESKIVKELLG